MTFPTSTAWSASPTPRIGSTTTSLSASHNCSTSSLRPAPQQRPDRSPAASPISRSSSGRDGRI
jgi:hypothetical protein